MQGGVHSANERTLRFGVARNSAVTRRGAAVSSMAVTTARHHAFCNALAQATACPVQPCPSNDYPSLLDAMRKGEIDIAWLPPAVALEAVANRRALIVALPVRNGRASVHTALFAAGGSRIRSVDDLHSSRAAWVDPFSTTGYLVICAALRSRGVSLRRAFAADEFVGSHEAVVDAVLQGRADVGATYLHPGEDGQVVAAGWGDANVHVVTTFGPVPADVVAASMQLPADKIRAVQRALVESKHAALAEASRELFEAESFQIAHPRHLRPLESLLAHLETPEARASLPPFG